MLDGRTDGVGSTRPELQHGLGQDVGRGMPEGVEALVAVRRHDGHGGSVGQESVKVPAIAVHVDDDGRFGQARTDVGSQIGPRRPLGKGARRTVGEGDGQIGHGHHEASDPAPPPDRRLTATQTRRSLPRKPDRP